MFWNVALGVAFVFWGVEEQTVAVVAVVREAGLANVGKIVSKAL